MRSGVPNRIGSRGSNQMKRGESFATDNFMRDNQFVFRIETHLFRAIWDYIEKE